MNPALAMGQAFESRLEGAEIRYVGVRGRAEEVIVPKAGLPISYVYAGGIRPAQAVVGLSQVRLQTGLGLPPVPDNPAQVQAGLHPGHGRVCFRARNLSLTPC